MLTLCRDGGPCCVSRVPDVRVQKRLWFLSKVQVFPLYTCVLLWLQVWNWGLFLEPGPSHWLHGCVWGRHDGAWGCCVRLCQHAAPEQDPRDLAVGCCRATAVLCCFEAPLARCGEAALERGTVLLICLLPGKQ